MKIKAHFKQQIDEGATERFLYGIENVEELYSEVKYHNESLDTFPDNLEYIRTSAFGVPFFKVIK